jgi:hypothetical protein
MRIIIILAAIVLLSNSSSLQQVQQVQAVQALAGPENQGVIECIVFYSKDIIDVKSTCGAYVSDNAECYKEYRAVELCLINNNCQYPKEATSVPYTLSRFQLSAGTVGKICHCPLPSSLTFRRR